MKKYTITHKQVADFNKMLNTLRRISKDYMTPDQMRSKENNKNSEVSFHGFEEYITMSYENIQSEARVGCAGIRPINIQQEHKDGIETPAKDHQVS